MEKNKLKLSKLNYFRKFEKVEKSEEEGFTGEPSQWFNDEEYYSKLKATKESNNYTSSCPDINFNEEIIKDQIRTLSFKAAIDLNAEIFKDKIVLEIGCGTCLLSILAANAGAKHVYALENTQFVEYTKEIVLENSLLDKITVIKDTVNEIYLPVSKVDIIIADWMGPFLLKESMLESVIFARDKWLNEGGYILPDKATINLASINDEEIKNLKINFWENVYDIDMSCLRDAAIKEMILDNVEKKNINSSISKVFEIDLYTVTNQDLQFSSFYELTFLKDGKVHAIVAWFDIIFNKLPNRIQFSTSPFSKPTHWKQCIMYLQEELSVSKGEILKGSIAVKRSSKNRRDLDAKISFHFQGNLSNSSSYQLYKLMN